MEKTSKLKYKKLYPIQLGLKKIHKKNKYNHLIFYVAANINDYELRFINLSFYIFIRHPY